MALLEAVGVVVGVAAFAGAVLLRAARRRPRLPLGGTDAEADVIVAAFTEDSDVRDATRFANVFRFCLVFPLLLKLTILSSSREAKNLSFKLSSPAALSSSSSAVKLLDLFL